MIKSLTGLFVSRDDERIFSMTVIQKLMLGINFRYAVAKDRAVNTGNIILIEQALIAVNYADGLVVVANDFFLQAQIVNHGVHFSLLGKFDCLVHELLVPSFRA